MVSSTLTAHQPSSQSHGGGVMMDRMEELSVARALIGVSPPETKSKEAPPRPTATTPLDSYAGLESLAEQAQSLPVVETSSAPAVAKKPMTIHSTSVPILPNEEEEFSNSTQQPQNDSDAMLVTAVPSTGLDALAALASEERHCATTTTTESSLEPYLAVSGVASAPTSSDEEEEEEDVVEDQMMPPPPRRRQRSASNPEGMEKWDSLNRTRGGGGARKHFVLPAAILEEELAEASAAVREREMQKKEEKPSVAFPKRKSGSSVHGHDDDHNDEIHESEEDDSKQNEKEEEEEEEEEDESMLTPEELLRKARSRLLEDLSEGSINGEKGQLMLPHALGKYKHVYNRNGRIGIYTPSERAAIIARFNQKRQRRVWNKKIRYNCRKSLADRRLRVKGRFVKRSEQEQLARELMARAEESLVGGDKETAVRDDDGVDDSKVVDDAAASPEKADEDNDAEMPDVDDPEAGFAPTEDQPYRRIRRYTIT